jgi:hypothetical protein
MEYMHVELSADTPAFQGPEGESLAQLDFHRWALSSDGRIYRELHITAQAGGAPRGRFDELLSYQDPYLARI